MIEPGAARVGGRDAAVGIAYGAYAEALVAQEPGLVNYVEIPFEQLVATPSAIGVAERVPVVLHCASLSLAGNVPPSADLVAELERWIRRSGTPWLGEHLAYVRADGPFRELAEHPALTGAASGPFNVGYTVSPQLSPAVLQRVAGASEHWRERLGLPLLLENGPHYFAMPGSTLSQLDFVRALCERSPDALLLLDLAHFAITCENLQLEPFTALASLPLERVVEVHVSGARRQSGVAWDDHTEPASPLVFALLAHLLERVLPRAVTLEYNWDAHFPREVVRRDAARVRTLLAAAECRPSSWTPIELTRS